MLLKVIQFAIIYLVSLLLNEVAGETYPSQEIPKPLKVGTTLEIRGSFFSLGERFEIDFMDESDDDIGFHMKFESELDFEGFELRRLAFNNRENGKWSDEEVYKSPDVPPFPKRIRITARTDHFQIDLDDDTYTFKYRMPIERIKFFAYGGDFNFDTVFWK